MATLPASSLVVTNLVSSSGAVRLQGWLGNVGSQTIFIDWELTATQNAALATALAATAGTVTRFDFAEAESTLPGLSNAL